MSATESDPELRRRAARLREEAAARVERQRDLLFGGPAPRTRRASASRARIVLLSAFAVFLLAWVGRNTGGPLGVNAAFTPGAGGTSFAGARTFEGTSAPVPLTPGDVVGSRDCVGATLALGGGRIELGPGARAAVASLMPPRARLLGGTARVDGTLRVVTAHGVLDVEDGACSVGLDERGLRVSVESGAVRLTSADGVRELGAGESASAR